MNNQNEKVHVFERAGLGKYPYVLIDVVTKIYQGSPGSSCAFCGTGIKNCYIIQSSDGLRFDIGSECIKKSDDKGLMRMASDAEKKMRRDKEDKIIADLMVQFENIKDKLTKMPHPNEYYSSQGKTYLDYIEYTLAGCGRSGKIRNLKKCIQYATETLS